MAQQKIKPLAAAVGAAFMASVALTPVAFAGANPFQFTELHSGYEVASKDAEGKCGEGNSAEMKSEKAAGEGKCGEMKSEKAAGEGKCGEMKSEKAAGEGKCGEGKCGEDKVKAKAEGKCGEGKCGGKS